MDKYLVKLLSSHLITDTIVIVNLRKSLVIRIPCVREYAQTVGKHPKLWYAKQNDFSTENVIFNIYQNFSDSKALCVCWSIDRNEMIYKFNKDEYIIYLIVDTSALGWLLDGYVNKAMTRHQMPLFKYKLHTHLFMKYTFTVISTLLWIYSIYSNTDVTGYGCWTDPDQRRTMKVII